jgi:hypothetical protein
MSTAPLTVGVDPQQGLKTNEFPDPTTFPAWQPPDTPEFKPFESGYVRSVLAQHGELVENPDGSFGRDLKVLQDRMLAIVLDRVVTESNLDRAATIGLDRNDLLNVVYGRPAIEVANYREEARWLTADAWSAISAHGPVSKRLPHGTVMVDTVSGTYTRLVTYEDGTQGVVDVKPRFATTVAANFLNHNVTPAGNRALKSVAKAVSEVIDAINEFPEAKELFVNKLIHLTGEINGALSEGLEKSGYSLQPAKITQVGPGSGAKRQQLNKATD